MLAVVGGRRTLAGQAGIAGWRRSACRESGRASNSAAVAASTDACGRQMPGAPMRRAYRSTTRITQGELAALNRRARFPAAPRVGTLRIAPAAKPTSPPSAPGVVAHVRSAAMPRSAPEGDWRFAVRGWLFAVRGRGAGDLTCATPSAYRPGQTPRATLPRRWGCVAATFERRDTRQS